MFMSPKYSSTMPTPGYIFRDSGATPPNEVESTAIETKPGATQINASASVAPPPPAAAQNPLLEQKPSESHALATENHELKGAAQEAGKESRITDLGWQANAEGVATMVGGLPNEELWTLVRRFNKVFIADRFVRHKN
jgi:Protein of unknown function (DUF3292)